MSNAPASAWFDSFVPFSSADRSRDPLRFPGYRAKLEELEARTGRDESVVCGLATCGRVQAVAIVFCFEFLGGSVGEAAGRRIVDAIRHAAQQRVPLLTIAASGGARMQEGMASLAQMQAIAAALNRLRDAGCAHLAVACHPTTGGVWAALVSTADVILAEAGASVAFTGARVRDSGSEGPEFTAEGKLAAGAVDVVLPRDALRDAVGRYLDVLGRRGDGEPEPYPVPAAIPGPRAAGRGWKAVEAARAPGRPRAFEYLQSCFERLAPISGDRVSGRDPGMLCGIGVRDGRSAAYIAQTGGANTPAGFRTAIRLLRLAEMLRLPVLTLIDTAGADASERAERAGVGTAIGQLLRAVAEASVPITSLLIGQGNSGGAIALAAPTSLWAVPDSYFSVLAPESAATILYRDPSRARDAAEALAVDPASLVELGVAQGIASPAPAGPGDEAMPGSG